MAIISNDEDDRANNFGISFRSYSYLPTSGSFPVWKPGDNRNNPAFVGVGFYYNTDYYIPSEFSNSYLIASVHNSKSQLSLDPTWFVNYDNHNDSVLISGVFRAP